MADRTWETREQPILEAVAKAEESGVRVYLSSQIGADIGLTETATSIGFRGLEEDHYLTAGPKRFTGGVMMNPRLLGKGRRAVGQWPADPYDELVTALRDRIAHEDDPEARGRLQRLLEALGDVGQKVATSVLTDYVKRTVGL
jgi:hypothetical protein